MELDVRVENVSILCRNHFCLVEGHNFAERLENCLIGSEDEGVVAEPRIFRILLREQKLIEDTGGHEDRFP